MGTFPSHTERALTDMSWTRVHLAQPKLAFTLLMIRKQGWIYSLDTHSERGIIDHQSIIIMNE